MIVLSVFAAAHRRDVARRDARAASGLGSGPRAGRGPGTRHKFSVFGCPRGCPESTRLSAYDMAHSTTSPTLSTRCSQTVRDHPWCPSRVQACAEHTKWPELCLQPRAVRGPRARCRSEVRTDEWPTAAARATRVRPPVRGGAGWRLLEAAATQFGVVLPLVYDY